MNALLITLAFLSGPPDDVDAFFARFSEKRAGIQVLEAEIKEESIQFGEVIRREGHLLFGQPRRIIFRYGDGEPSLMIDERRVYEFDPLEEQLQIHDIDDSPEASIFFLGLDNDVKALREAYDVRLFSIISDQGDTGLAIRPKEQNAQNAPFEEVSIYLRDTDYLPSRIEVVFDEETRMVTEFANYRTNHPVEPAQTQLRVPAGTRVIENNEVVIRSVPEGGMLMPEAPLNVEAPAKSPAEAKPAAESPGALEVQELPAP